MFNYRLMLPRTHLGHTPRASQSQDGANDTNRTVRQYVYNTMRVNNLNSARVTKIFVIFDL